MPLQHAAAVAVLSCLLGAVHGLVIDPSTPKNVIQRAFHCGPARWIGSYNEFYQQCQFLNTSESVVIANTTLNAASVFADVGVLESMRVSTSSYHIELDFHLDGTATTHFTMSNASIVSSAVYIYSQNISVDATSSINTTGQGLKFGPGFNSAATVGSAYGGTGGSALSNDMLTPSKCADVDIESTMYMQVIGDLKGSVGDFRGYGSGGGSDATRGAGFIELNASHTLQLDGAVLANGGFDAESTASRSGSGGTIRLLAKVITGKGRVEACGGNATAPGKDSDDGGGGGGGGGGGRVVLEYEQGHRGDVSVHVHGGTHAWETPPLWCQEGGAGTFLDVVRTNATERQGTVWILGRRKEPPAGLMAGTPLFYRTARRELMVEPWMLHVRVAQHAVVFASTLQLESHANSSIEVEAGSFWATLVFNETIQLVASTISIAGRIGPMTTDRQSVLLFASEKLTLAPSAQVIVHSLTAHCSTLESDGAIVATHFVTVDAFSNVRLGGHVEVEGSRLGRGFRATLNSRNGSVALHLDKSSQVAVPVEIRAVYGTVDLDVSCVLHAVSIVGDRVNVVGEADLSKQVPILGSASDVCQAWPTHADVCTAEDPPPFALSIAATSAVSITHSLVVSSLLVCSPQTTIQGTISALGLGCSDGGPGQSRAVSRVASGGAGHGGAGGDVMPAKEGAGRAFEASAWPQWPGSSAASTDAFQGGKGGGLIVFVAKTITLDKDTVVSVRGGNGTRGGGGGSGGTIVLGNVVDVAGQGTLDLSGGSGSTANGDEDQVHGGGGGGGVLWIHYQDKGSGRDFHGRVALNGGFSAGQTGFDGVAKGDACGSGSGGLFCLPCTPGTFSPAPEAECTPCPIGSYSDKAGATTCSKCPKGQFNPNPGSRACVPCATGQYSPSEGAATCAKCPPGAFSDKKGQDTCALCPTGTVAPTDSSSQCAECGVGQTTDRPGAVACRQCSIKPEHATYNKKGSCVYMCDKGHIGLDCLTPFEKFIQPIGGPLGFVLLCFVTILSVFGIYGYVSSSYGASLPAALKQYQAVRAPAPHSNATHLPRLTDHQLTFHVARLYFGGANTFSQPWHVPTDLVVGPDLRKTIYEGSYAGFASKCNAICTGHAKAWSNAAHVQRLARLVVPPLATWLLRRYQRATVKQVFEYVTEYGTGFFRDLDVQASGAHLILGYSSDYSLGYIDLLLSPDAARRTHDAPPPPPSLLFVAAGNGSFVSPFYMDTNDALLRAVPSRVEILRDSVWLEFVATLNQLLRLVTPTGSIDAILDHVQAFNAADVLNGHTVEFGVFTCVSQQRDRQLPFQPATIGATPTPDDLFERVFESQPLPEHAKWAIYVVPDDRHRRRHLHPLTTAPPVTAPVTAPASSPMPDMNSIRYAALYAPDPAAAPSSANTTPLLSDDDPSTSRYPSKLLARRSSSMELAAWTSAVLAPWSHVQVVATPYTWLLPYSLLLLLSMDFFTMLWILIEYFCIQVLDPMAKSTGCSQVAFELVLLCMPGAILGAPVLGIVFVLQRHSLLGRVFILWTHVCWINMLLALVCDGVYHAYLGEYVLVLVLAAMAMKYMETHVALYVLAQFEGTRMGRGWKGLFTTDEYYDAAYRRF